VLTARSRSILQKIISSQLVKKFPAIYGPRSFITAFTKAWHSILKKVVWLQPKMGHFRFSRVWKQNLTFSFMIWDHIRLLIFLNIALLQCTVRLKCRYFLHNWNIWKNYNILKHRMNYSLKQTLIFPYVHNTHLFSCYVQDKFLPYLIFTSKHKWQYCRQTYRIITRNFLPAPTCLYVYQTTPRWHGIATSHLLATAFGWP
jgi:hypothetical protein